MADSNDGTGEFLAHKNGRDTKGLALGISSGAADAGKIVKLNADGVIDETMIANAEVASVPSFENLAANDQVNVFDDAGTFKARKADATTPGKEACGFVKTAVTAPAAVKVYGEGTVTGQIGLTTGDVFLSTTAGLATQTAPTAAGNISQKVGSAKSATEFTFEAGKITNL